MKVRSYAAAARHFDSDELGTFAIRSYEGGCFT